MSLRTSPLISSHRSLGARLVEFGGWEMPLSYPGGTLSEHMACRRGVAVFDVSHLGTVRLEEPDAFDRLQYSLSNDLNRIGPGRAQYTHLLDESDGSVLDDIIVWWRPDGRFDVMPNASNTERVRAALGGTDVTAERAVIAVQGPRARSLLGGVSPEAAEVARFGVVDFDWQGTGCVAAGTGYTGEDGVECAVPAEVAESFWSAVVDTGAVPAGLGARDTLRLEAGLPLHGHELGPGITPLQAGLGWVVGWDKGDFRGRAPLERERAEGVPRHLVGLVADGRQPPRPANEVSCQGQVIGEVTSGNFSPCLERGIGMALVVPSVASGDRVEVEARGRHLAASLVPTPFVGRGETVKRSAAVTAGGDRQGG